MSITCLILQVLVKMDFDILTMSIVAYSAPMFLVEVGCINKTLAITLMIFVIIIYIMLITFVYTHKCPADIYIDGIFALYAIIMMSLFYLSPYI